MRRKVPDDIVRVARDMHRDGHRVAFRKGRFLGQRGCRLRRCHRPLDQIAQLRLERRVG